jgi:hypothetical protein
MPWKQDLQNLGQTIGFVASSGDSLGEASLWSQTTVIVGFEHSFRISHAADCLKRIPGFARVKHGFRLTNSVLVEVYPNQLDLFINTVRKLDGIAYCEYDYLVRPASFEQAIGRWSSGSGWSRRHIKDIHGLASDLEAGTGIKIAVMDTGMSQHPYLPTTSFTQSRAFTELWPDRIGSNTSAEMEIRDISGVERSGPAVPGIVIFE